MFLSHFKVEAGATARIVKDYNDKLEYNSFLDSGNVFVSFWSALF
jgi:hypothetical protein